jgi:hypothetical protein
MQIILMERVVNLGGLGDVVKVKDGYARNFLIPQGKAKRATEANRKVFEEKRAELERIQAEAVAAAQAEAAKLEGLMLQITRKTGVDGRLFGSVSRPRHRRRAGGTGHPGREVRDPPAGRPAQEHRRYAGADRPAYGRGGHRHRVGARRAVSRLDTKKRAADFLSGPFCIAVHEFAPPHLHSFFTAFPQVVHLP